MKQNKQPQKQQVLVAITGGIGSGKSTVLSILNRWGYSVYNCDAIAKDIYLNEHVFKKVQAAFPNVIENNCVNRVKLAESVFKDSQKVATLNAITHPVIMQKLLNAMQNTANNICFAEVPLLFEGNFQHLFHHVLVVMRPMQNRVHALQQRDNLTVQQIQERMQNQFNYANTISSKHIVINNTKDIKYLECQLKKVLHEIKQNSNLY